LGEEIERPRILLTGPTGHAAEYADAARAAGWSADELPLLEITPVTPMGDEAQGAFDWIVVTSSNALSFLGGLIEHVPELAPTRCAVVGARSAERAEALGLHLDLPPATDAHQLAEALIAAGPAAARVLWPRGPRSRELGETLRTAGWRVEDPLAYDNTPRSPTDTLPVADAIFFASPSAVYAFTDLYGTNGRFESSSRAVAVAIGPTTFAALLGETRLDLCDTISLPEPTPEALRVSLEHLDARSGP